MQRIIVSMVVVMLCVVVIWAHDDEPTGDPVDVSPVEVPENPTYYEHIKPILDLHCVACHSEGQIAGDIPLDTVDDAVSGASDIAFNATIGYMPPWMPSDLSLPMHPDRGLTYEEIATLTQWSDNFAPQGDPDDYVAPENPYALVDVREDMILQLEEPYQPDASVYDDYRCFAFEMALDEPQYLTAYELIPDVTEMAHHGIIYKVDASASDSIQEQDGADGRPGWSCYGGVNLGGEADEMIGTWTPGTFPVAFPDGTGYRIDNGEFLIIQMHYNLALTRQPDQTMLTLQFADAPVQELMTVELTAPVEIPCPNGVTGTQCDRNSALDRIAELYGDWMHYYPDSLLEDCDQTLADYAENTGDYAIGYCDETAPIDITVYGVFGHMHELGSSFRFELNPDSDNPVILLDIPAWDFHWQDRYTFAEPFHIQAGDVLRMTCVWDNTQSDDPRYVVWGEGTADEMCFGTLMVLQPGQ